LIYLLILLIPIYLAANYNLLGRTPIAAWFILTVIICIGLYEVLMGGGSTSIVVSNWLVSAGSSITVEWIFLFDVAFYGNKAQYKAARGH
jgi:pilus assembly protein TadC